MGASSLPRIETALDHFEERLLSDTEPPDVLAAVASLSDVAGFAERRGPWEMAMMDLELRWRRDDPRLRRGTEWYAEHLGPLGLSATDIEELSTHEMIVRSRWVDRPRIDQLVGQQFPAVAGELRQQHRNRLVRQMEIHFPIFAVVRLGRQEYFRSEVRTPCVFGRQRSTDPAVQCLYLDKATRLWRIVVAPRQRNSISRDQVMVRRLAIDQLLIEPLSHTVGCYLGGQRMQTGQPEVLRIGMQQLELRFHDVTVRFFPD